MSVIIRLQNLPWSANAGDIRRFFHGLSIPEGGVHIVGGENGDAFIAFSTDEDARKAMMLNPGIICNMQVKLFLSSKSEMQTVIAAARAPAPSTPAAAAAPAAPAAATPQLASPPTFQPQMPSVGGGWSAAATSVTQSQPPFSAASRYPEESKFSSPASRYPEEPKFSSPASRYTEEPKFSSSAPRYPDEPKFSSASRYPEEPKFSSSTSRYADEPKFSSNASRYTEEPKFSSSVMSQDRAPGRFAPLPTRDSLKGPYSSIAPTSQGSDISQSYSALPPKSAGPTFPAFPELGSINLMKPPPAHAGKPPLLGLPSKVGMAAGETPPFPSSQFGPPLSKKPLLREDPQDLAAKTRMYESTEASIGYEGVYKPPASEVHDYGHGEGMHHSRDKPAFPPPGGPPMRGRGRGLPPGGRGMDTKDFEKPAWQRGPLPRPPPGTLHEGERFSERGHDQFPPRAHGDTYPPISRESSPLTRGRGGRFAPQVSSGVRDMQGNEFAPMSASGTGTEEKYPQESEYDQHYLSPNKLSRPPPPFRGRGGIRGRGAPHEMGAREIPSTRELDLGSLEHGESHELRQEFHEWQEPPLFPRSTNGPPGPLRGAPTRGRPFGRGGRGRGDFPRPGPPGAGEFERKFPSMETEERDHGRNMPERGRFGPPPGPPGAGEFERKYPPMETEERDRGRNMPERGRFGPPPGPGRGRGRGGFDLPPSAGNSLLGDPPQLQLPRMGDRDQRVINPPSDNARVPSLFDAKAFPQQDTFEPNRNRLSGSFDHSDFDRDTREMRNIPDRRPLGTDMRKEPSISPVRDSPNRSFDSRRGNRSMDRSFDSEDRSARDSRREDDRNQRRMNDARTNLPDSRSTRGSDRRRDRSRDRSPVRSRDAKDSRKDDKRDDRRTRQDDRRDNKSSRDRTRDSRGSDSRDDRRSGRDDRRRDSRDRDSRSKTDVRKDSRDDGKSKTSERSAPSKDGDAKATRDDKQDDKGGRHTPPLKSPVRKDDAKSVSEESRKRKLEQQGPQNCVSVKGLPQNVTFRDVRKFFTGCEIKWNGLKIINDDKGKRTGSAFVQFDTPEMASEAVRRSGNKMNDSVLTVSKCPFEEFEKAIDSFIPGTKQPTTTESAKRPKVDPPSNTNVCVKNLPSDVEERDILEFFKPLKVKSVFLNYDRNGGVMESGYVEFEVQGDGAKATRYNGKDLRGKTLVIESIDVSEQPDNKAPSKAAAETKPSVPNLPEKPRQSVDNKGKQQPPQQVDNTPKPKTLQPSPTTPKPKTLQPSPTVRKPAGPSPGYGRPEQAFVAKLEGIPYEAQLPDLVKFCDGLKILPGGIHLFFEADGRAYQNAYIELATARDLEYATRRTGRRIGRRFVTVKSEDKETLDQELKRFGGSTGCLMDDAQPPPPNVGRGLPPNDAMQTGPVVSIFDLHERRDQREEDGFSRDRKPLLGNGPQKFGPLNAGAGLLGAVPSRVEMLHEERMGLFHEEDLLEPDFPHHGPPPGDEDRGFPPMGHDHLGPPPDHRRGGFPHRGRGRLGHPMDMGRMPDEDHRLDGRGRRPPMDAFPPRDGDHRRPPFGERGPHDQRPLLGEEWEEEPMGGPPRPSGLLGHKPALLGDAPLDLPRSAEGDKLPASYQGHVAGGPREPLLVPPGGHGTSSQMDHPKAERDWFPVAIKNAPSKVTLEDILEFFMPLRPLQDSVKVRYRSDGTPTGDVLVAFAEMKDAGRAIRERNMKLLLGKPVPVFKPS